MLSNIGLPGLLIILIVVVLVFGRGRIAGLMGEVATGIKSFRKGLSEDEAEKKTAELEAKSTEDNRDKV